MTRSGEPSLRDLELLLLGAALTNGACRTWLLEWFTADDFSDDVTRRLFLGIQGGRSKIALLLKAWEEPMVGGELAMEPIKRLFLTRTTARVIERSQYGRRTALLGVKEAGERARIHAEYDAAERERFQKLADAEAALRPKPKEEAKA